MRTSSIKAQQQLSATARRDSWRHLSNVGELGGQVVEGVQPHGVLRGQAVLQGVKHVQGIGKVPLGQEQLDGVLRRSNLLHNLQQGRCLL